MRAIVSHSLSLSLFLFAILLTHNTDGHVGYTAAQTMRAVLWPIRPDLEDTLVAHLYAIWPDGERDKDTPMGFFEGCVIPPYAKVGELMSHLREQVKSHLGESRMREIMDGMRPEHLTLYLCLRKGS